MCRRRSLCKPPFACQVEANINEALTRVADEVTKPRDMLYKVIIFNMTYLGPSHASCLQDAARILSDQLTNDPDRGLLSRAQMRNVSAHNHPECPPICATSHARMRGAVAIVFLPNSGVMGAGCGTAATTSAQRAVAASLEDECWKLEVRECQLLWDEASMYSAQRALAHPFLIAFSRDKVADGEGFRNKFSRSHLYVRRALVNVPVMQRAQFVNPSRKVDTINVGLDTKLSEAAEMKQHISGPAFYSAVPGLLKHTSNAHAAHPNVT